MSSIQSLDALRWAGPGDPPRRGRPDDAVDVQAAVATSAATQVPPPARRWLIRVGVPLTLLGSVGTVLSYAAREALLPETPVRVLPVIQRSGVASGGGLVAQAPGWVEAEPYVINISALTDGVVKEMLVLEGEPVQPGQLIARLVDDDARLAQQRAAAEVAMRRAALATAEAARAAAQSTWDHPVERERLIATTAARLAETRAELQRWPAELAAQRARAAELLAEHERVERLRTDGAAGAIEAIRAEQQYLAQAAQVESTRGREAVLLAQSAALEAELSAARENLRLRIEERRALDEAAAQVAAAEATLQAAEAALREAELRLSRMEVRSPVGGIVMTRLVEPGSRLMLASDMPFASAVARVYNPERLQMRVDIPLADAAKVSVGMRAEIVVHILPDRTFHGRVTRIVPEADIQRNTLQVKVEIFEPAIELRPEMLAKARFFAPEQKDESSTSARLFAPEQLIRSEAGGALVWLADTVTQRAVRRSLVLGSARADTFNGAWIEVRDGLRPGDRLIVDPPTGFHEGQRIRIEAELSDPRNHGAADAPAKGADRGAH